MGGVGGRVGVWWTWEAAMALRRLIGWRPLAIGDQLMDVGRGYPLSPSSDLSSDWISI